MGLVLCEPVSEADVWVACHETMYRCLRNTPSASLSWGSHFSSLRRVGPHDAIMCQKRKRVSATCWIVPSQQAVTGKRTDHISSSYRKDDTAFRSFGSVLTSQWVSQWVLKRKELQDPVCLMYTLFYWCTAHRSVLGSNRYYVLGTSVSLGQRGHRTSYLFLTENQAFTFANSWFLRRRGVASHSRSELLDPIPWTYRFKMLTLKLIVSYIIVIFYFYYVIPMYVCIMSVLSSALEARITTTNFLCV